jgi:cell division protein FtsB
MLFKSSGAVLFIVALLLGMGLGFAVASWLNPEPTATTEYRTLLHENATLKAQISDLETRVQASRSQTREKVNRIASEVHKKVAPMSLADLRGAFLLDLAGPGGAGPGPSGDPD